MIKIDICMGVVSGKVGMEAENNDVSCEMPQNLNDSVEFGVINVMAWKW